MRKTKIRPLNRREMERLIEIDEARTAAASAVQPVENTEDMHG